MNRGQHPLKIGYLMQAGVPDVRRHPLSGPANHVKYVFEELCKRGHRLRLLAILDKQIWKSEDLETFDRVVVRPLDQGVGRLIERAVRRTQYELRLPYAALFDSWRFALACHQELADADLFYERMGWMAYGGGLAARWLRVPLILEVNGDHLSEMELQGGAPQGVQRWLSKVVMKRAVGMASYVVAAGEGWRRRHIERWDANPDRIRVIQNGSGLVSLLDRRQLHSFSEDSSLGGITTIAYAGGFQPWQGVALVIRAFARVLANGLQVRLLLIGSGPGVAAAERLANELHLEKYVTFTGQLNSLRYAEALAQADIGVCAYCNWASYSGLKLLDYKAAGLAIVASGEGAEPDVIKHGKSGWIVRPGDEDALYEAINCLVADVARRKQMGRSARVEAEQGHGWNKTAERLDALFSQTIREFREREM